MALIQASERTASQRWEFIKEKKQGLKTLLVEIFFSFCFLESYFFLVSRRVFFLSFLNPFFYKFPPQLNNK